MKFILNVNEINEYNYIFYEKRNYLINYFNVLIKFII